MKTKLQNFAISLVWTIQSSHLSFSLHSAKPSTIQNMLLQFDLERSSIWLRSTRLKSFSPEQSVSVSTLDIETILYLKTLKLRALEIVTALYQYYLSSTQIVDEGWRSKRFLLSNFFAGRNIELILWRHQLIKTYFSGSYQPRGRGEWDVVSSQLQAQWSELAHGEDDPERGRHSADHWWSAPVQVTQPANITIISTPLSE